MSTLGNIMTNKQQLSITRAANYLIKKHGLANLSRKQLCDTAGVPDGSFIHIMECSFSEFVTTLIPKHKHTIHSDVHKTRISPTLRKEHIFKVALNLACQDGYRKLSRDKISRIANVSPGLVNRYFKTMKKLKREILQHAINNNIKNIIEQGIKNNDIKSIY